MDINLQQQCIKEASNFGNTVYMNVCNGSSSIVPWGSLDWFGWIFIGVCVVVLGYFGYKIIKL